MKKVGRRFFLHLAMTGVFAGFVFIWNKITLSQIGAENQKRRKFPFNRHKPVWFSGSYIFVNENEETIVLSAHCTHLGCVVNQTENGRLICPCHGSEYDTHGRVMKGPAYRNLTIIPFKITEDGTQIEVEG
jgi:Rieske Fe-S protein